jgi:hypothetical protein
MERIFDQAPVTARQIAVDAPRSGVVWAPIFAGAIAALATSIILISIGSGLGFAAASPWPGSTPSATSFAVGVGVWLIVTQWLSAALGGFLTGRLRTAWTGIHTKEVVFRDTAHGLLAWAVATTIVAAVGLATAGTAVSAVSSASSTTASYAAETLLRTDRGPAPMSAATAAQISHILTREGGADADDQTYVANVVAAQTGVSKAEAQARVKTVVGAVRAAADKARKASAIISFYTALSMLIGAFIAAAAAGYGGSYRDEHADVRDAH